MLKDIVEVKPLGEHRLYLRFEDGVEGEVDLDKLISFNGVFEPLRDPALFKQVSVNSDLGTICWPNGADLAPEMLYGELIS